MTFVSATALAAKPIYLLNDVTEFVGLDFPVAVSVEKVHERAHLLLGKLQFGAKVLGQAVHELST